MHYKILSDATVQFFCSVVLLFLCTHFEMDAQKTKVTLYNSSEGSILSSIDTKPYPPPTKNEIRTAEAKNFFLPGLQPDLPFYMVVEASNGDQKVFMISLDRMRRRIILSRGGLIVDTAPIGYRLIDGIRIDFRGSLEPNIPEAYIIQDRLGAVVYRRRCHWRAYRSNCG